MVQAFIRTSRASRISLLTIALIFVLQALQIQAATTKQSFASNDAFTPKEHCILNVLNGYRNRYLKFQVKLKSKKIMNMFTMERKLRAWRKKMGLEHEQDLQTDWSSESNSRALRSRSLRISRRSRRTNFNDPYSKFAVSDRKFAKSMGDKIKIFGRLFTPEQLKDQKGITEYIQKKWVSSLRRGKYFNQESFLASEMQDFMVNQFNLYKRYRIELSHCKLNTDPSMKRCESQYGKGNCEVMYSGVVHNKCKEGLQRVGCCSCASPCPSSQYVDDNYYCQPAKTYHLDVFHNKAECEKQHSKCSLINNRYVADCVAGFERMGDQLECRITCPQGWKKTESGKCLKPHIVSLGTPFIWIKSDN